MVQVTPMTPEVMSRASGVVQNIAAVGPEA